MLWTDGRPRLIQLQAKWGRRIIAADGSVAGGVRSVSQDGCLRGELCTHCIIRGFSLRPSARTKNVVKCCHFKRCGLRKHWICLVFFLVTPTRSQCDFVDQLCKKARIVAPTNKFRRSLTIEYFLCVFESVCGRSLDI